MEPRLSRASSLTNHVGFLFTDFGLLRKVFLQFTEYIVGISYLSVVAIFRIRVIGVFSFVDKC